MSSMAEIRARFPEYKDVPDADLAEAVRLRFYPDVPRETFLERIGMSRMPQDPVNRTLQSLRRVVGGSADAAVQGATFGFGDEIGAVGEALGRRAGQIVTGQSGSVSENYDQALADRRQKLDHFESENPVLAGVSNLAGSLTMVPSTMLAATPAAIAAAGRLPTALQRLMQSATARSAATGAAFGAAGGFGEGEGGVGERLASAGAGAGLGATIGAALPALVTAGGQAAGVVRNMAGLQNPERQAETLMLRTLQRDGMTPEQLGDAMEAAPRQSAIDSAGRNMQRLGRTVETVPGKGSDELSRFLNERQMDQGERLMDTVRATVAGTDDAPMMIKQLMAQREKDAAPLYAAAYAQPVDALSDDFQALMKRPSIRSALARAKVIAEEEGRDPTALGFLLDDQGNAIAVRQPSMQTLDYVKRGLDDVIEEHRDPVTRRLKLDERLRAVQDTKKQFVGLLDDANEAYRAARAAWGGPTSAMDAINFGSDFAKLAPNVIADRLKSMTPSEREFARIGVAAGIRNLIDKSRDGADSAARLFGSPLMRKRMQMIIGSPEEYQRFADELQQEIRMAQTRRVVTGGSPTGRIAAEQDDANDANNPLTHFALSAAERGLTGAVFQGIRQAASRVKGINEQTSEALVRFLTATSPEERTAIVRQLTGRQQVDAQAAQDFETMLNQFLGSFSNTTSQTAQ